MTTGAGQPDKAADLDEARVLIGIGGARYVRPPRTPGEPSLELDRDLVFEQLKRRRLDLRATRLEFIKVLSAGLLLAGVASAGLGLAWGRWDLGILGAIGGVAAAVVHRLGIASRRIKIIYQWDESASVVPSLVAEIADALSRSERVAVETTAGVKPARGGRLSPGYLDANTAVAGVVSENAAIWILPDRVLIEQGLELRSIEYADLDVRCGSIRVDRSGPGPRDARVVGTTWRYTRKDGGPDLRYRDNPPVDVLEFGTVRIASRLNWNLTVTLSRFESAEEIVSRLRSLAAAFRKLAEPARPEPIPVPRRPAEATPSFSPPVWKGMGTRVEVGPFVIEDPLTYLGAGLGRSPEVSCIDVSLPIGSPRAVAGRELGSFITYGGLAPDDRATYLAWLAGGRADRTIDTAYALLFFYGLERRLMIDEADHGHVVAEAARLLETRPGPGAFQSYVRKFLAFAAAGGAVGPLDLGWYDRLVAGDGSSSDEETLAAGLAWLFLNNRPLPAGWAFRVARDDPRTPRSVVPERLPDAFRGLFETRYRENFGEGLTLKAAKRDREMIYQPANPSLLALKAAGDRIKTTKIPHVIGIQSQFVTLVELWTSCVEELKPAGRVVGKSGGLNTRAAFEALPPEIRVGVEHPDKSAWDRLAAESARPDGSARVPLERLATIQGIEPRPKLTMKQSEGLALTAGYIGYLIEPDPRITGRPFEWKDRVALLQAEGTSAAEAKDSKYQAATLMLEIGMYVASADGEIVPSEVDHVATFLESRFRLDPTEIRRLEALKGILVEDPPSLAGVGKRVASLLDDTQREAVGRFLVGVAAAGGTIDAKEVRALRAAYKALSIDPTKLDTLLDELRVDKSAPRRSTTSSAEETAATPIALDESLLKRIMNETEQVARLLGEAMNEADAEPESEADAEPETRPDPEPKSAPAAVVSSAASGGFDGLEIRYHGILVELLARENWPRSDFEALARRHSLMPSGTMDVINEWAESTLGDLVLEEEGASILVHARLIPRE